MIRKRGAKMKSYDPIVRTVNVFLLRTTAIFVLLLVLAGTVTVRQRAQKTMAGQTYPVCSFVDSQEEIGIQLADTKIVIKKQIFEKVKTFIKNITDLSD